MSNDSPGLVATYVSPPVAVTLVIAAIVGVVSIVLTFMLGGSGVVNWLLVIVAVLGGWSVGSLLSPWGKAEQRDFSRWATAITTFFSGYVIGKMDSIIQFFDKNGLLTQPLALRRYLLFAAWFLLAGIVAFATRRYAPL